MDNDPPYRECFERWCEAIQIDVSKKIVGINAVVYARPETMMLWSAFKFGRDTGLAEAKYLATKAKQ